MYIICMVFSGHWLNKFFCNFFVKIYKIIMLFLIPGPHNFASYCIW